MKSRHSNPRKSRQDRERNSYDAFAPYNFVPLPEKVVEARPPLQHERYYTEEGHTGWIDYKLETCAPVYVRGMLSETQYREQSSREGSDPDPDEKSRRAPFFSAGGPKVEGFPAPLIPGSTVRGLIRSLVEIAGYGAVRWVGSKPTFTFRAVAASKDDPLRAPYQQALGPFGRNVRAGYLKYDKRRDSWEIVPAVTPESLEWPGDAAYLKVKEKVIQGNAIPNFIRLNSSGYRPQIHPVSFGIEFRTGKRGQYVSITQIGSREDGYQHKGFLVCSGNMLETSRPGQRSPRKNHALVLESNSRAAALRIDDRAVQDYLDGLTPFQRDELRDWSRERGCLGDGKPVFYVAEGSEVIFFGHCPNFRFPARVRDRKSGKLRAANPADFVPPEVLAESKTDLADAIFGWVKGGAVFSDASQAQRAGRVSFGDARFVSARQGVWYQPQPVTLHTLGGPKPTTFQHYLVQDKRRGHDPDDKASLAHYGTTPEETAIRGHKLYWHRGANPDIEATAKERAHPTQLTEVIPLKPGVAFSGRIHFENLREEELGALLWALTLPADDGKAYRHKLGMGKPLGMGAVAITARLRLTDRDARYRRLFNGEAWNVADREAGETSFIQAFEKFVLTTIDAGKERLAQLPRIQALLAMLEWQETVDGAWLDKSRYMEIERGVGVKKINEYKERPVLPDPVFVRSSKRDLEEAAAPEAITREAPSEYHKGVVKEFGLGPSQSFGFITPSGGGEDIFVHRNQLRSGLKTLQRDQKVRYRIIQGMKGPQAEDVHLDQ